MVFLWVHGYSFGSKFVFFFPLYICVFPLKSTSVSFRWVYGMFMFFVVCIYGYADEERCASHKEQGRSCGRKICFSPAPLLSLVEDLAAVGVRRY